MNEVIQHAHEVALDILKPSPRDVEHGMELHQNSIVCDSYGFAPRAGCGWGGCGSRCRSRCIGGRDSGHDRRYVYDPICHR